MEFVRDLFDSIRKMIRLIQKGKKNSQNLINFEFKICSIRKKMICKIRKCFQIQLSDSKNLTKSFLNHFGPFSPIKIWRRGQIDVFSQKCLTLKKCSFYLQFAKKNFGKSSKQFRWIHKYSKTFLTENLKFDLIWK